MPSITVDAPNEDIDLTICLDDHLSEIEVDLNEEQIRELVDDDPDMVLDHIWDAHPEVVRAFVRNMDAGERLALFTAGEKADKYKGKKNTEKEAPANV